MHCSEFSLKERVAVVTGACGFLGEEHCDALAEAGAKIVLVDIEQEKCEKRAYEIQKKRDTETLGFGIDITDKSAVQLMLRSIIKKFGKVDILINNAQMKLPSMYVDFEELSVEDWNKIINVNLTGAFICCQVIGAHMRQNRYGSIINIGSIYGMVAPDLRIYEGSPFNTPAVYSVTKAGIYGLTKYLAVYWAGEGIRVNAITPGGIFNNHEEPFYSLFSNRVPMKRMGNSEELRGAIKLLASDASSYITGQNLIVDGGWTTW